MLNSLFLNNFSTIEYNDLGFVLEKTFVRFHCRKSDEYCHFSNNFFNKSGRFNR